MRVFFTVIIPLLLPTAIYLMWLRLAAKGEQREVPWVWLGVAGVVLMASLLAGLTLYGGAKDGIYVPPHVEDGRIVPGRTVPSNPH